MDLVLARRVLDLVEAQPYGFAKLRGRHIRRVAEEMRSAGLVQLSADSGDDPNVAIIKEVTEPGRKFLRALRPVGDKAIPSIPGWQSYYPDLEQSIL